MRKLLTLAIPIILGVGVLTALVSNPNDGQQASRRQGGVAAENALPAPVRTTTFTSGSSCTSSQIRDME